MSYRQIVGGEYRVRVRVPKDLIGIYKNHLGQPVRVVTKFCATNPQEFEERSPAMVEDIRRQFADCRRRSQQETDPALETARRAEAALERLIASGDVDKLQEVILALADNTGKFIAEARKKEEERKHANMLGLYAENNQYFNDGDASIRRLNEHGVVGTMSTGSQEIYWDARTRIDASRAPPVVIPLDMAIADWKADHGRWRSPEAEKKATEAKERAAKSLFAFANTTNMAAIDTPTIQQWKDGLAGRRPYDYVMDIKKLYRCLEKQRRFPQWMQNSAAAIETPRKPRRKP